MQNLTYFKVHLAHTAQVPCLVTQPGDFVPNYPLWATHLKCPASQDLHRWLPLALCCPSPGGCWIKREAT